MMRIGRRAVMAMMTFLLAVATGHLMQNGKAIAALIMGAPEGLVNASLTSASTLHGAVAPKPRPETVVRAALGATPALPDLPLLEPAAFDPAQPAAPRADLQVPPSAADADYDTFGRACGAPSLTLAARAPAMLDLMLSAACLPGAAVTVSHAGLTFAGRTDAHGQFSAMLPALSARGDVTVRVGADLTLFAARAVPDLSAVRRFALVTRGHGRLHLNAWLADAAFGSDGHLHPDNPGAPTLAGGGFLTLLGDPTLPQPVVAEVFTAPATGPDPRVDLVALTDKANCGRDLIATTFRTTGAALPETGAVSLAMPDCAAAGQRLVLDLRAVAGAEALAEAAPAD